MAYDTMTITAKGAELLAAATSIDKLLIAGCDATQTYLTKEDAVVISSRPATPFSTTTNARLEPSTANHVIIRAFFVAGESTGGEANSLYIYGHLQSDTSHDYVLAVLSSQTSFHLPVAGDISNIYGVLVDIIYNPAEGAVSSVTASVYATYGEFADLRDRAVTTHIQGNTTTGEAQTIYGEKTFKNTIISDNGSYDTLKKKFAGNSGKDYLAIFGGMYGSNYPYTNWSYLDAGIQISSDPAYYSLSCGGSSSSNTRRNFNFGLSTMLKTGENSYSQFSHVSCLATKDETNQTYHCGRVSISASESTQNLEAYINVKADHDLSDNPYTEIELYSNNLKIVSKSEASLQTELLRFYVFNDISDATQGQVTVNVNGSQFIVVNSIDGTKTGTLVFTNNETSAFTLYPRKTGGATSFDLGSPLTDVFDNVYATDYWGTSFHGSLDGNASSATSAASAENATNDADGNPITSYFRSWDTPTDAEIAIKQGNGATATGIYLNTPAAFCAQGKQDSLDQAYTQVGGIGLFVCSVTSSSYPTSLSPGATVPGTTLKAACIRRDISTGSVYIDVDSTAQSGTWTLLSLFKRSSSNDDAVVLAVKTATT